MGDPTTRTIGVWVDPLMEWKAGCKKTASFTVQQTVRYVAQSVVSKVNNAYCMDPPLNVDDMVTNYYPEAAPDTNIHDIGQNGLIVLIRPQHPDTQRVKRRFKALQKSDKMTSALFNVLDSDEDDSETNSGDSIDDLVNLFRGLQKDIEDHKEETAQLKAET
ncbi:hypothetical protein M378DRAFT_17949, partial [Amanita muscaria Koide BX008]